jgi:hypothetical protein
MEMAANLLLTKEKSQWFFCLSHVHFNHTFLVNELGHDKLTEVKLHIRHHTTIIMMTT